MNGSFIPLIDNSTKKEREEYIESVYGCKHNCEICGMCSVFKGKSPEIVFGEYIEGKKELSEILL